VLLLLILTIPVRPRRRLRIEHAEAMIEHSSDDETDGPLIGISKPLQAVMNVACDPRINPDFKSLFHGHARPCSADAR
jgi:hypothetical protein